MILIATLMCKSIIDICRSHHSFIQSNGPARFCLEHVGKGLEFLVNGAVHRYGIIIFFNLLVIYHVNSRHFTQHYLMD